MTPATALQAFDTKEVLDGKAFVEVAGRPVLGIGLTALFLFRDGSTPERRDAVAAITDEYFAMAKEQLKWQVLYDNLWIDLRSSPVQPLSASGHYRNAKGPVTVSFYSREQDGDAGAHTFHASCRPSWEPRRVSFLSFTLPLNNLNLDYVDRFQGYADLLQADQAYAGVGALQMGDPYEASKQSYLTYALAQAYPGLSVFSPYNTWESLNLTDTIGAVNWLTAVSNRYLERLGGWETVARQLNHEVTLYKYNDGVLFQAGKKPDLGGGEHPNGPELYRQVARALKPVRYDTPSPGFFGRNANGPTFTEEETAKWLARFD